MVSRSRSTKLDHVKEAGEEEEDAVEVMEEVEEGVDMEDVGVEDTAEADTEVVVVVMVGDVTVDMVGVAALTEVVVVDTVEVVMEVVDTVGDEEGEDIAVEAEDMVAVATKASMLTFHYF